MRAGRLDTLYKEGAVQELWTGDGGIDKTNDSTKGMGRRGEDVM